jgi:hypothetical protein
MKHLKGMMTKKQKAKKMTGKTEKTGERAKGKGQKTARQETDY